MRRHELLGESGAYELLQLLYRRQECCEKELEDQLSDFDAQLTARVLENLERAWFVERVGGRFRITDDGMEAYLLLRVINGASLESVINQLSLGLRRRFGLITEDITGAFFQILSDVRNPKEILLCSPWIRLDSQQRRLLATLFERRTRLSIVTRSPSLMRGQESAAWRGQVIDTLKWLLEHGATVAQHRALHTKLYVVDAGYYSAAIFGSENLTGAGNIELAIQITDETLVKRLIAYWDEVFGESELIGAGELNE